MTTLLIAYTILSGILLNNFTATEVSTEIKEATVYRNGALITRTASVSLVDGKHKLIFNNLSPSLRPATIQLGGTGRYTLLSLSHDYNYLQEVEDNETISALRQRKVVLEEKLKRIQANIEVEKKRERFLDPNRLINAEEKYTTAELESFLEFYSAQSIKIQNRILDLNTERTDANEELKKVTQQLNELSRSFSKNTSEIIIEVESNGDQNVEFSISYLIAEAGWYPTYDIRVDNTDKPVDLIYKASIYQNSGYDWNDIELSVSSANPNENATKPELAPWYVDFYKMPSPVLMQEAKRNRSANAEAGMADLAEDSELDEINVYKKVSIAEFSRNTTSFTYKINGPYSIESGKGEATAIVSTNQIKADFSFATVPSQSKNAFLIADLSEWGDLNLLSGSANLYFENTFIGRSYISPFSTDDTLNISLGTDKSIIVDRKSIKDFEERRFFGSKTRETKTFEIAIRNTKSESIKIEIQDQIPVSVDEGIKISLVSLQGAIYDKETGFLRWNRIIEAGSTETIRFSYTIEYPKGKKLNF